MLSSECYDLLLSPHNCEQSANFDLDELVLHGELPKYPLSYYEAGMKQTVLAPLYNEDQTWASKKYFH